MGLDCSPHSIAPRNYLVGPLTQIWLLWMSLKIYLGRFLEFWIRSFLSRFSFVIFVDVCSFFYHLWSHQPNSTDYLKSPLLLITHHKNSHLLVPWRSHSKQPVSSLVIRSSRPHHLGLHVTWKWLCICWNRLVWFIEYICNNFCHACDCICWRNDWLPCDRDLYLYPFPSWSVRLIGAIIPFPFRVLFYIFPVFTSLTLNSI